MLAELHLAEDAFALHFLLQRPEGLVDIVVTDKNLQMFHSLLVKGGILDKWPTGSGARNVATRGRRAVDASGRDVKHGDPLVAAGAAQPVTVDEALAAIFGGQRTDRCVTLADRAKPVADMIVVLSHACCSDVRVALPTALDPSGNVDGEALSHGNLPCSKAGAQAGLSAIGGRACTDGLIKIGAKYRNNQLFVGSGLQSLGDTLAARCSKPSFDRTSRHRRAMRRTGDLLPDLDRGTRLRNCAAFGGMRRSSP
jgi:hypothetical protein